MIVNRKANFDYFVLEKFTAGIVLLGPEAKSIRNGDASIGESFCYIKDGEVFIKSMYVKPYKFSRIEFDPTRERKLLLTKKEIRNIADELSDNGKTIIPLSMSQGHLIKVNIGVCKGKKNYDKRQTIKERQAKREINEIG